MNRFQTKNRKGIIEDLKSATITMNNVERKRSLNYMKRQKISAEK